MFVRQASNLYPEVIVPEVGEVHVWRHHGEADVTVEAGEVGIKLHLNLSIILPSKFLSS